MNVQFWVPRIQRLPGNEFLVVDVRGWQPQLNAHVHTAEGALIRSFHLAGTEDVFADPDGWIWASYDDESANSAAGSSALVRLNDRGQKQWGFNQSRADAEAVWMFYALNVHREVVWGCGYTEFEVVRIERERVDHWRQEIGAIDEIAVSEPHVLLLGAYHRGNPRFWLGRLGHDEIEDVEEVRMTLPDRRRLADLGRPPIKSKREIPFRVVGRRNALHVFAEDHWYRVRVEDVVSSA